MQKKTSIVFWAILSVVILVLAFSAATSYANGVISNACIQSGDDAFDLETGYGGYCNDGDGNFYSCPDADFYFFSSDGLYFAPINGAGSTAIEDISFEEVDYALANTQVLSPDPINLGSYAEYPTVVVRTGAGRLFKVGNLYEGEAYGSVCFDYQELEGVPFGEASYIKVPAGQKTLCIDRLTGVVEDCDDPGVALANFTIEGNMTIEIEIEGVAEPVQLPLKKVKDETLIEAGTNSCYPWCYKGKYYVLCY